MKKKFLSLLMAFIMSVPAFASVAVSPMRVEVNANKVKTNYYTTAIEIKGDTKEMMRFRAYPGYFKIDDKGEAILLDKSNEPNDLSKKIRFVPSEFNIAPGKVQKLRINIAGLNLLPDGESRAMLYIEDVNPKELALDTGRQGIGAQLIVKTRVGVPIYVDKGKFKKQADVEYLNIIKAKNGLFTEMKILSTGNSRIRYDGKVQIIQGKKLIDEYSIDGVVVGDNNSYVATDKIRTEKIEQPGEYTLRMIVSYYDENGKKKNIKKETILNMQGKV